MADALNFLASDCFCLKGSVPLGLRGAERHFRGCLGGLRVGCLDTSVTAQKAISARGR